MTAPRRPPTLFEVAANPDPDSSLPFLIRLPPPDGELVLKARDSWPRTAKVYCHRAAQSAAGAVAKAAVRRLDRSDAIPTVCRQARYGCG